MSAEIDDRREMTLRAKLSLPEDAAPAWSLLSALLSACVLLVCLVLVGPALASLLLGSQEITPFLLMLSWALGMGLCLIYLGVSRRSNAESWAALRLGPGHLPRPLVLLLGVAIALAADLVVNLGSGEFQPVPEIYGFNSGGAANLLLAALLLILLQPLAESLVFQAMLLPSLRWRLGPWLGVFVASGLFVARHLLVFWAAYADIYKLAWHGLAYPALTGLAFCLLRVYTGSSSSVIIARMAAGLIFFLTALAVSGA
ncbi:MAG: CPBP family intramembrane metalloprotease [Chloroflexi bacterium]|nr:CPBP family intramembrane metalloprotease [Chloroflexota bacterium]